MSILKSVITGRRVQPPRITIYGPGGVGKTTWASGAPSPIILATEDGRGNLSTPTLPLSKSMAEVGAALVALREEEHAYKTLIVDSLDHLEPLIWRQVIEQAANPKIKSIEDFGYGKGYVEAMGTWRKFFGHLADLRDKRGMAIVLVAHHEIKAFQDPTSDPYDRYQIKLHKAAAGLVQEWSDAVLFATYQTTVIEGDNGKTRGVGCGKRTLLTEERPTHVAKNRWSLPYELDMPLSNSFQPFADALRTATVPPTPKEA